MWFAALAAEQGCAARYPRNKSLISAEQLFRRNMYFFLSGTKNMGPFHFPNFNSYNFFAHHHKLFIRSTFHGRLITFISCSAGLSFKCSAIQCKFVLILVVSEKKLKCKIYVRIDTVVCI